MHILLLDDQPSLLSPLRDAFQTDTEPVIIDNVPTVETALLRLQSRRYDWLVTDLIMKGMNGVDLVNTALKEDLIAPRRILVVTTLSENTILIRAIREQGIHILQKPVSAQQIRDSLHSR